MISRASIDNALGHIGMGLIIMSLSGSVAFLVLVLLAILFGVLSATMVIVLAVVAAWIGWYAQAHYWLGREVRDHENVVARAGVDITNGWRALLAFLIWRWSADGRMDLLAPVIGNAGVAAFFTYFAIAALGVLK